MKKNLTESTLLNGVSVLDLADEKASFCTKLLAEMGARVIKVEKPGGDPARRAGPYFRKTRQPAQSLSFCYNNTNKQSITLNLEHPKGREIFKRLVKRSDVVVETWRPDKSAKTGLGFDGLSQINSQIIVASVTGFGQCGPKKNYKTCDLVASALGGQMSVCGSPDSYPLKHYGLQSYLTASLFAAVAILIALRQRRVTGKGEHIDISLQETVLSSIEHIILQYFYNGVVPGRQGRLHWNHLFYIFPCKDGFIQMTIAEQWETLVEWMDSEGLAGDLTDEKWRDNEYRLNHLNHIIAVLTKWTKTHTQDELFKLGQLMRFPWAPVQSPKDILRCPQLEARGYFKDVRHANIPFPLKHPRLPFVSSGSKAAQLKPAPLIGEDNMAVYQNELNISEDQLKIFSSEGII
jgi:crotonobetainyl-CoA:carnitine CoA-transferase CaiB-like acyl-CoA transferase